MNRVLLQTHSKSTYHLCLSLTSSLALSLPNVYYYCSSYCHFHRNQFYSSCYSLFYSTLSNTLTQSVPSLSSDRMVLHLRYITCSTGDSFIKSQTYKYTTTADCPTRKVQLCKIRCEVNVSAQFRRLIYSHLS